jgi:hypothetical protein
MATKLGFKRILATILAAVTAAGSVAARDWMPLLPDHDYYDFQVFAPPDFREYSLYHSPNEGVWFQYDRLIWVFSPPDNQLQASARDTSVVQFQVDSNFVYSDQSWGNRYEVGYFFDGNGLMASGFQTLGKTASRGGATVARIIRPNPAPQNAFGQPDEDEDLEDYPFFNRQDTSLQAQIYHNLETYGLEIDFAKRIHSRTSRSAVTLLLGPRYFNFADRFGWTQTGTITQETIANPAFVVTGVAGGGIGGGVAPAQALFQNDTRLFEPFTGTVTDFANINATNSLVGPQLGTRLETAKDRWKISGEFRVAPMVNFQNIVFQSNQAFSDVSSSIGTGLGQGAQNIADQNARFSAQVVGFSPINQVKHYTVFSMLGEYRADLAWQVSRDITLRAGYTGMVVSNITRSPGYLGETNPDVGVGLFELVTDRRWQEVVFMNGFDFGFEFRR